MKKAKKASKARKTTTTKVRVHTCGVVGPLDEETYRIIHNFEGGQIFEAHRLRNKLVEGQRDFFTKRRQLIQTLSPEIGRLTAEVDVLTAEIDSCIKRLQTLPDPERAHLVELIGPRSLPKSKRDKSPEAQAIIAELKELKGRRKVLWKQAKTELKEIFESSEAPNTDALKAEREQAILILASAKKPEAAKYLDRDVEGLSKEEKKERKKFLSLIGPSSKEKKRVLGELSAKHNRGSIWDAFSKLRTESHDAAKSARQISKCSTGTYQAVVKAATQSAEDTIGPPRFVKYEGRGLVGVQFARDENGNGVSIRDILDGKRPDFTIQMEDGPCRGNKAFSQLVYSMPDATPEAIFEEAKRRGFKRRTTRLPYSVDYVRSCVLNIRSNKRRTKLSIKPQKALVTMDLRGRVLPTVDKQGRTKNAVHPMGVLRLPIIMHRPLPEDAIVTWVYLKVDRVGLRTVYQLQFTLEAASFDDRPVGQGTVAIDLGWRALDNGDLLVGTTWDGANHERIVLPAKMRSKHKHAQDLIGVADKHFDNALKTANIWLKTKPDVSALPEHVREKLKSISQWHAHSKLASLARALITNVATPEQVAKLWRMWREERLSGRSARRQRMLENGIKHDPNDLFDSFEELSAWFKAHGVQGEEALVAFYLEWWRRKDAHLINWARNDIESVRLWRQSVYRTEAARLARTYERVILKKWDKAEAAEDPAPEKDTRTAQEERSAQNRQFAGISRFVSALKHASDSRVLEVNLSEVSTTHFGCGGQGHETLSTTDVTCLRCHRGYDQDTNASRHLFERFSDAPIPGSARNDNDEENQMAAE